MNLADTIFFAITIFSAESIFLTEIIFPAEKILHAERRQESLKNYRKSSLSSKKWLES